MAEERIEITMTPERRTKPRDGNSKRNSTGRTITSNSGEKVLPHYLRASTSSCHDFCKYGRRHTFEAKGKHPIPIRTTTPPTEEQKPVKNATPMRRNTKPVVKPKPSLSYEPKTQVPDKPKVIKQDMKIVHKVASLSPSKKIDVGAKPAISSKPKLVTAKSSLSSISGRRNSDIKIVNNTPTSKIREKKTLLVPASLSGISGRRNSGIKEVSNTRTSKISEKKVLVAPLTSLSPKMTLNRIANQSTSNYRTVEAASPLKNQNKVREVETMLLPNDDKFGENVYVIEPIQENKSLGPIVIQSSPSSSISLSPPSPSLASIEEEEAEEEEEEDEEEEEEGDSESTLSEENISISDNDETEEETLKEELMRRPRRVAMVHPEGKDSPHKLHFRRGKVVDLQAENNRPKRLKFRQGRVIGDDPNVKGDIGRRSFRRRREERDVDANSNKVDSRNVVLRHQDAQGKKDAQGLFNNVIEETASKLVETRKSKVKALVGAFETVISLQETRPSTTSSA